MCVLICMLDKLYSNIFVKRDLCCNCIETLNWDHYLSVAFKIQLDTRKIERVTIVSKALGYRFMSVLTTKRVLKEILFMAPMLREETSLKSLLCKSMHRQTK